MGLDEIIKDWVKERFPIRRMMAYDIHEVDVYTNQDRVDLEFPLEHVIGHIAIYGHIRGVISSTSVIMHDNLQTRDNEIIYSSDPDFFKKLENNIKRQIYEFRENN